MQAQDRPGTDPTPSAQDLKSSSQRQHSVKQRLLLSLPVSRQLSKGESTVEWSGVQSWLCQCGVLSMGHLEDEAHPELPPRGGLHTAHLLER